MTKSAVTFDTISEHPEFKATIVDWYYHQWGKRDPNNSLESYTTKLDDLLANGGIPVSVVGVQDGELVATAHLRRNEIPSFENYEFWLGGVYVHPSRRASGVASQLVKQMIAEAKQLGIETLYLQTENLTGGLYAKLGWEKRHQLNNKGVEVIVMAKELSSDA